MLNVTVELHALCYTPEAPHSSVAMPGIISLKFSLKQKLSLIWKQKHDIILSFYSHLKCILVIIMYTTTLSDHSCKLLHRALAT